MSLPRSISVLASAVALFSLVAGCTAGGTGAPVSAGSGTRASTNADCQSPGSHGIANYSFGGPCGITGPTITGSVQILAHVQVNPHRQLTLQLADAGAHLYGSYDQCSCAADTATAAQGGPSYASYQPCDPSMDTSERAFPACTTTFDNTVTGTVDAANDGPVTVRLMDGSDVLEELSFEVATPASIDVKATSGAAGAPALTPDASGVYQVHLADSRVVLEPHLLTADGRTMVVGGGRAVLSGKFSDSRVLTADPKVPAGHLGILLAGAGDASVTISDGAKLATVLKFHVAD